VIKSKAFKKGCETIKKEMINFHTFIGAIFDWLDTVLELPFVIRVKAFIS
jgi:hypothetical protein